MAALSSHGRVFDVGEVGVDANLWPVEGAERMHLGRLFVPARQAMPVELEIGSGKGTFLVQHAAGHPDTNFVGIEYAKAFWRYAADRCRRHGLENVRMIHGEAGAFVRSFIADATLQQVHVYFPDPWPKKRHHKRRLIQEPFLRELVRTLVAGGCIRLATDHADYFQWMQEQVGLCGDVLDPVAFESPGSQGPGELVGTNFERKYRREGRQFQGMVLQKRA